MAAGAAVVAVNAAATAAAGAVGSPRRSGGGRSCGVCGRICGEDNCTASAAAAAAAAAGALGVGIHVAFDVVHFNELVIENNIGHGLLLVLLLLCCVPICRRYRNDITRFACGWGLLDFVVGWGWCGLVKVLCVCGGIVVRFV